MSSMRPELVEHRSSWSLVTSGSLIANLQRVFPGAKFTSQGHGKATNIDKLLRYLSSPELPARVSTKEIGGHFGRPWREFSSDLTGHRDFDTLLRNAGWSYLSKQRPAGAYFERIEGASPTDGGH